MTIRSLSIALILSTGLALAVACGGPDDGASTASTEPAVETEQAEDAVGPRPPVSANDACSIGEVTCRDAKGRARGTLAGCSIHCPVDAYAQCFAGSCGRVMIDASCTCITL